MNQQLFTFYLDDFDEEPRFELEGVVDSFFPSCLDMANRAFNFKKNPSQFCFNTKYTAAYMLCFSHNEKTPSLRIKRDYAQCYGCGQSWTPAQFYVSQFYKIGAITALSRIGDSLLDEILERDGVKSEFLDIAQFYGYLKNV